MSQPYDWAKRDREEACRRVIDLLLDGPPGRVVKLPIKTELLSDTIRTFSIVGIRMGYRVKTEYVRHGEHCDLMISMRERRMV